MITIHNEVVDLVSIFRTKLEEILSKKLHGLYLYNSVAMGNFEPQYSDIDFVVILKSELVDEDLLLLKTLHERIASEHKYGAKLDGMYLQYDMIGKMNSEIEPYPYAKEGSLFESGYFDINNVTWWSLKEYEMAIDSPSIYDELLEINFNHVIQTMNYNLNEYWLPKLQTPEKFNEDMWVEFAVVTLSRIVYTLKDREIKPKSQSCYYVLEEYNEWQDVINEALAIRNLKPNSIISDTTIRKDRTVDFIGAMIKYGNDLIQARHNCAKKVV